MIPIFGIIKSTEKRRNLNRLPILLIEASRIAFHRRMATRRGPRSYMQQLLAKLRIMQPVIKYYITKGVYLLLNP